MQLLFPLAVLWLLQLLRLSTLLVSLTDVPNGSSTFTAPSLHGYASASSFPSRNLLTTFKHCTPSLSSSSSLQNCKPFPPSYPRALLPRIRDSRFGGATPSPDSEPPQFLDCPAPLPPPAVAIEPVEPKAHIRATTAPGKNGAVVYYSTPTAIDAFDGKRIDGVVSNGSRDSGSFFPIGEHRVVVSAVDEAGNEATCSFVVVVEDTEAPVFISCPPLLQVMIEAGQQSAPADYKPPRAIDNSKKPVQVKHTEGPDPDEPINEAGRQQIVYVATDSSGNKAYCRFPVVTTKREAPSPPSGWAASAKEEQPLRSSAAAEGHWDGVDEEDGNVEPPPKRVFGNDERGGVGIRRKKPTTTESTGSGDRVQIVGDGLRRSPAERSRATITPGARGTGGSASPPYDAIASLQTTGDPLNEEEASSRSERATGGGSRGRARGDLLNNRNGRNSPSLSGRDSQGGSGGPLLTAIGSFGEALGMAMNGVPRPESQPAVGDTLAIRGMGDHSSVNACVDVKCRLQRGAAGLFMQEANTDGTAPIAGLMTVAGGHLGNERHTMPQAAPQQLETGRATAGVNQVAAGAASISQAVNGLVNMWRGALGPRRLEDDAASIHIDENEILHNFYVGQGTASQLDDRSLNAGESVEWPIYEPETPTALVEDFVSGGIESADFKIPFSNSRQPPRGGQPNSFRSAPQRHTQRSSRMKNRADERDAQEHPKTTASDVSPNSNRNDRPSPRETSGNSVTSEKQEGAGIEQQSDIRQWLAAAALVSPYVTPWINMFVTRSPQVQSVAQPPPWNIPVTSPPVRQPSPYAAAADALRGGGQTQNYNETVDVDLVDGSDVAPPLISLETSLPLEDISPAPSSHAYVWENYAGDLPSLSTDTELDPTTVGLLIPVDDSADPITPNVHAEYLQRLQSYHDKYNSQKHVEAENVIIEKPLVTRTYKEQDIYKMMNMTKPSRPPGQPSDVGLNIANLGAFTSASATGQRLAQPLRQASPAVPKGLASLPLDAVAPVTQANRRPKLPKIEQLWKDQAKRDTEGTSPSTVETGAPIIAPVETQSWGSISQQSQEATVDDAMNTDGSDSYNDEPTVALAILGQQAPPRESTEFVGEEVGGSLGYSGALPPLVARAKNLLQHSSGSATSQSNPPNEGILSSFSGVPLLSDQVRQVQPQYGAGNQLVEVLNSFHGRQGRDGVATRLAGSGSASGTARTTAPPPQRRHVAIDESLKQMVPFVQGVVGAVRSFRQSSAASVPDSPSTPQA